ncbi:MAG TPA: hypothetical protein VF593_04905 [Chthoniobacteraceae bacterium]
MNNRPSQGSSLCSRPFHASRSLRVTFQRRSAPGLEEARGGCYRANHRFVPELLGKKVPPDHG